MQTIRSLRSPTPRKIFHLLRATMGTTDLPLSLLTSVTFLSGLERLWSLTALDSLLQVNTGTNPSFPTTTWLSSATPTAVGMVLTEAIWTEIDAQCAALSTELGVSGSSMWAISATLRRLMSPVTF